MATAVETIRVVVTGANPSTRTFQVPVDVNTGAGAPLSIPLIGTNAGTDTITCYMDSHSLASNPAQVNWFGPTTLLARYSGEEFPMYILQGDAGGHPRPYDGSDVSLHPGNIVTVYYNDIHQTWLNRLRTTLSSRR